MEEKIDQIGEDVNVSFELLKHLEMPITPPNVDIMNRVYDRLKSAYAGLQAIKKEVENHAADSPE